MRHLTLHIDGMSCGHCLNAVNRALAGLPGVEIESVRIGRADLQLRRALIGPDAHRSRGRRRGIPGHGRVMTTAQIAVTVAGLAAIAWVNWYFFLAGAVARCAQTSSAAAPSAMRIEVKGGYTPAVVRVRAGRPVRLDFYRDETNPCTEEVVLPDFGIRTFLPAHQTTSVELHARPRRQLRVRLRHGHGARAICRGAGRVDMTDALTASTDPAPSRSPG